MLCFPVIIMIFLLLYTTDAAQAAMTVGVANMLCDDRSAPLAWTAPPPQAPPAPLWQYPGKPPPTQLCAPGSYAPTALRDRSSTIPPICKDHLLFMLLW